MDFHGLLTTNTIGASLNTLATIVQYAFILELHTPPLGTHTAIHEGVMLVFVQAFLSGFPLLPGCVAQTSNCVAVKYVIGCYRL